MTDSVRAFRGFRFPAEVILWAVRWYLQFPISYRDLERIRAIGRTSYAVPRMRASR
jgi:transposase-like protein